MTAARRIRQYLSRKVRTNDTRNGNSSSSSSANDADDDASNGASPSHRHSSRTSTSLSSALAAARRNANNTNDQQREQQQQQQQRRRLQRGWWPDAQKRAERSFQAMQDLKDETFVVTEEHFEWIFDETDEDASPVEPQCYLILPPEISSDNKKCNNINNKGRTSNECAICMAEYDLGDVVIASKHCSHAFHQTCILDWIGREKNVDCPSCRTVFWDPKAVGKKDKRRGAEVDGSQQSQSQQPQSQGRHRSNTADTEILIGDRSSHDSMTSSSFEEGNGNIGGGALSSVVEQDV